MSHPTIAILRLVSTMMVVLVMIGVRTRISQADGAAPCVLSGEGLQEFVVSDTDVLAGGIGASAATLLGLPEVDIDVRTDTPRFQLDGCGMDLVVDGQGYIRRIDLYPANRDPLANGHAVELNNWTWEQAQEIAWGFIPYDSQLVAEVASPLPLSFIRIEYLSPALADGFSCDDTAPPTDDGGSGNIGVYFFVSDAFTVGKISIVTCRNENVISLDR